MVAQITLLTEPIVDSLNMTSIEFEEAASRFGPDLQAFGTTANQMASELNIIAADVAAGYNASASLKWIAGTFVQGAVVWSPTDFLDYRCKVAGVRNIDPAIDPTNWEPMTRTTNGGADTTGSAVDITLTSNSGRLQIVSMTAPGKKVTMPSATTIKKGATVFLLRNTGIYRFSAHKNGGGFLCYVQPGQSIVMNCSDISTAAGVWHIAGAGGVETIYGGNAAEVLSAVDSRSIAVANLSATKAICAFRNNVNGFIHAVVLNFGSASGSSAAINAEASDYISIAAQTATQATVVYKGSTGATKGVVLDVSGNTITPGTIATVDATTTTGTYTGLTVLSTTKLLCVYSGTPTSTVRERVLDIASSAITAAAEVVADATATQADTRRLVGAISATKALVAFKSNGATNFIARLQSITGSTPAPTGTALTIPFISTTLGSGFAMAVLSTDRAVICHASDSAYADLVFYLLDTTGTSPVLVNTKKFTVGLKTSSFPRITKLDANNLYVAFNGAGNDGVDGLHIRITGDDSILMVSQLERIESTVAATDGYVNCAALDSTHVMQVCRNASTFLSARTIEIAT